MGFCGYDKGSQLNNFLAENSSRRFVIFLHEFDKTQKGVRDALLLTTEKGMLYFGKTQRQARTDLEQENTGTAAQTQPSIALALSGS